MAERTSAPTPPSSDFPLWGKALVGGGALAVAYLTFATAGLPPVVPSISEPLPVYEPAQRYFTVGECGPNWEPIIRADIQPVDVVLTRLSVLQKTDPSVVVNAQRVLNPLLKDDDSLKPIALNRGDIQTTNTGFVVRPEALLIEPDIDDVTAYRDNWKKALQLSGSVTLDSDLHLSLEGVSPINVAIINRSPERARVKFNLPGIPAPVCAEADTAGLNLDPALVAKQKKKFAAQKGSATRWALTDVARKTASPVTPTAPRLVSPVVTETLSRPTLAPEATHTPSPIPTERVPAGPVSPTRVMGPSERLGNFLGDLWNRVGDFIPDVQIVVGPSKAD